MDFRSKIKARNALQDAKFLEHDRLLLKQFSSSSPALSILGDSEKQQKEILWALLDITPVSKILQNRGQEIIVEEKPDRVSALVSSIQLSPNPAPVAAEPLKKKFRLNLDLLKRKNIKILHGKTYLIQKCKRLWSYLMTELTVFARLRNWIQRLITRQPKIK